MAASLKLILKVMLFLLAISSCVLVGILALTMVLVFAISGLSTSGNWLSLDMRLLMMWLVSSGILFVVAYQYIASSTVQAVNTGLQC
ncbi:Uncharacterised protein [Klebsiella pneumoniae]|nr:Uncharacterised protein [Klebsiella pneumoniae]SSN80993.1 Uncharacterised protein [Klebsiella pneumoniae]